MPVSVRLRTTDDLEETGRLLQAVHERDGYPVEGVADPESWLSPPGLVCAWVGELDGSVVGHALVTRAKPGDDAVDLWVERSQEPTAKIVVLGRLFVGPEGRGHGVGEQLTRAAMDFARERDNRLVLDVMEKDRAAIRLYQRLGWKNIGGARHRFGSGQEVAAQCYVAPR